MRRIPDWLIYAVVFIVLSNVLFGRADRDPAPEASSEIPAEIETPGRPLPPPSRRDPGVLVNVGPVEAGVGTAFALSDDGLWLTARHVVDGCVRVGLMTGLGRGVETEFDVDPRADIALLRTPLEREALGFDLARELRIGDRAYHVGFPQGRPGEATSKLLGRERLIARGRYQSEEPVLAWAETGRTRRLSGSLGGISGGPAFAEDGSVIGVTVAESPRRGRIYTVAPRSLRAALVRAGASAKARPGRRFTPANYGRRGDRLRRDLQVAKVFCLVDER